MIATIKIKFSFVLGEPIKYESVIVTSGNTWFVFDNGDPIKDFESAKLFCDQNYLAVLLSSTCDEFFELAGIAFPN